MLPIEQKASCLDALRKQGLAKLAADVAADSAAAAAGVSREAANITFAAAERALRAALNADSRDAAEPVVSSAQHAAMHAQRLAERATAALAECQQSEGWLNGKGEYASDRLAALEADREVASDAAEMALLAAQVAERMVALHSQLEEADAALAAGQAHSRESDEAAAEVEALAGSVAAGQDAATRWKGLSGATAAAAKRALGAVAGAMQELAWLRQLLGNRAGGGGGDGGGLSSDLAERLDELQAQVEAAQAEADALDSHAHALCADAEEASAMLTHALPLLTAAEEAGEEGREAAEHAALALAALDKACNTKHLTLQGVLDAVVEYRQAVETAQQAVVATQHKLAEMWMQAESCGWVMPADAHDEIIPGMLPFKLSVDAPPSVHAAVQKAMDALIQARAQCAAAAGAEGKACDLERMVHRLQAAKDVASVAQSHAVTAAETAVARLRLAEGASASEAADLTLQAMHQAQLAAAQAASAQGALAACMGGADGLDSSTTPCACGRDSAACCGTC